MRVRGGELQIGGVGHAVNTAIVVFGTLFVIYLGCRALAPEWYLHVHHYFALPLLIPVARYNSVGASLFVSSFCAAQCIEGAARWSAAPLWHRYKTA